MKEVIKTHDNALNSSIVILINFLYYGININEIVPFCFIRNKYFTYLSLHIRYVK